ncbi:inactive N-acetylated-alpha-linked acidic dipeptidase-like protein 2 [Bombina bombina]|uniref:inactive N-acetylated-alpha-linked acidic dipeptidase-like protein 2 n=1 Tax=Bombina bombina TaxID=8345 RepID=UPI00235AE55C|nr:inactive N-acetylated-alpha-linked acidic dipeptidase-like protein 2 [Bombina bombina]
MASIIESMLLKTNKGWRPKRTIIFCSWGGNPFGNIGSYKWGKEFEKILQNNAVAYIDIQNPYFGNTSLRSIASPSLQQLTAEAIKKMQRICTEGKTCHKSNVSSVHMQRDADFFINYLGIAAAQFVFDDFKSSEAINFISEAFFINKTKNVQEQNHSFHLHRYVAKLTTEIVLQISTQPILPFNALDVALEIQKRIEGDGSSDSILMEQSRSLRETAQLFQSNEMRPANNPRERNPLRVRMLNDILQNLEKNFLIQNHPAGFPRNILYRLDERTTRFSLLQEAQEHCKISKSNETLLSALQEVLNCITSATLYLKESLHVFQDGLEESDL